MGEEWRADMDEIPGVLVIGREDALGEMVAAELSDFEVYLASDVEVGLRLAIEKSPEAIILADDIGEVAMWQISCEFRRTESLSHVPVMVDSSIKNEQRMREAVDAGVYDLLFRPFSRTELGLRVRNMVRSRLYLKQVEQKNTVLNSALADLKESEAMLVQAEKLSQLGEMSAGIVHEINNPLNYAQTALYMMQSMVDELEGEQKEDFEEAIEDVREGVGRVSQIVRDLRAFSSKSGLSSGELNLSAVVQTSARLLGHKLSNIAFEMRLPEELQVFGNENQLCQVVLNLLKNGVEATEDADRKLEESRISVVGQELENRVELRIRDNGCGISEVEQSRVFLPFFSKKDKGKGMGLGLSICYRIIEEHGGKITVESEKGSYTEFILSFPRMEKLEGKGVPRKMKSAVEI